MAEQYLQHSKFILSDEFSGYKPNRTGVDTISRFGYQNEYDLSKGFPLLTTKKMFVKSIIHELIWFLRGDTNVKYLVDNDVHIWDDNAFQHYLKKNELEKDYPMYSPSWQEKKKEFIEKIKLNNEFANQWGDLGPVYGRQWRHWRTEDGKEIDQLGDAINLLKKSPNSRRIIITAWNPAEIVNMALPPCHLLFHFNVQDGKLDCQLYQRSCDMFLGVPFNIASYALLTYIMAHETGLKPGRFIHSFGDAHFYCGKGERGAFYGKNLEELKRKMREVKNKEDYIKIKEWIEINAPSEKPEDIGMDHVVKILEQLSRETKQFPKLIIAEKPIQQLTYDDFKIENYDSHPAIRATMAV